MAELTVYSLGWKEDHAVEGSEDPTALLHARVFADGREIEWASGVTVNAKGGDFTDASIHVNPGSIKFVAVSKDEWNHPDIAAAVEARATRVPTGQGQAEYAVWKYELAVDDEQVVEMPAGAELLHVGTQAPRDQSRVMLWARVTPCDPNEFVKRRILIRGTGHRVEAAHYVGTVVFQADGGVISLVWHIFDGGEEK